jgi:hypothetical protein
VSFPIGESEKANYITCPKGHKAFVIWSPRFKKYGFTCDECETHSAVALCFETQHVIRIAVVRRLRKGETLQ